MNDTTPTLDALPSDLRERIGFGFYPEEEQYYIHGVDSTLAALGKSLPSPDDLRRRISEADEKHAALYAGRPTPNEIAQTAWGNGHVPTFLKALCELLMCADPWPASADSETKVKATADAMARRLGFTDWVEAYHGL